MIMRQSVHRYVFAYLITVWGIEMNKQKDGFLLVCSLLLIAACLFSLFAGVKGFNDFQNIKDYKTQQKDEGLASIKKLEDGVGQLKENEQTYLNGVGTYNAGLATYSAGAQKLQAASAQLAAGEASYAAGQQKLAEGQQAYNAGQQKLAANTDAYNSGKQKLSMVAPIYTIAKATGVDPLNIVGQYEDGQAQIKQYEDGQQQLAAASQQLAAGQQSLAEGKQTLTNGYAQYNAGVDSLNAGAAKLASGKAQLAVYEDGEDQVAAGLDTLLATKAITTPDGTVAVESVADRLGSDYSYWQLNSDGSIKTANGHNLLDLDACLKAAQAGKDFINDQGVSVTAELMGRAILYLATFVICLLGAIAGIKGANAAYLPRKLESTAFMGIVTAILAVGANIYGFMNSYTGYTYPLEDGSYSGTLQFIALMVLAAAAVIFALVAYSAMANYKKALAAGEIAAASEPAAPVDSDAEFIPTAVDETEGPTADTTADTALESENQEKLKKLEKQEAELKEMLASLSGKISDIKHQTV